MADRGTNTEPGSSLLEARREKGWLVITSYEQKVVAEYPTRKEAEDAAEWYAKTWPHGPSLEVCRAS